MTIRVATFYHFFAFTDYINWRECLRTLMDTHGVMGTVLLAPEGINATIAGSAEAVEAVLGHLRTHEGMTALEVKYSECAVMPFKRTRIRLKKDLINMGVPSSPLRKTGKHLSAQQWNQLIQDESVLLLDTRNTYEVEFGTFEGAVLPGVRHFKDLPEYIIKNINPAEHTKIATFCTGGIRCEKLTSWMLEQGFEEVYQLQGGILKYLEQTPEEQSLWKGECFVFDEREAVGHGLKARQGK